MTILPKVVEGVNFGFLLGKKLKRREKEMDKAILVFADSACKSVEEILTEEGNLWIETIESPGKKAICYLTSSVDEKTAQAIEFLRVVQNTITFFVPVDLLERVEQGCEERYDLLPAKKIQSMDPRAITILAKGEAEPGTVSLVQTLFNEIELGGESRFSRLANMAILHEVHRVFSSAKKQS